MSIPQELSDDAVAVLMVLWKERFNIDFMNEGLAPEEIRQKAGYSGIKPIYEAINELIDRSDRWPTLLEVKPRSQSEGRKPKCYKLYTDGVSDWPRSSFFLMELNYFDKRRPRQIDAGEFCRHLLANCAFRDQDDLDTIISGLCSLDYLYRSPNLPVLARDKQRGYLLLSLNERSRVEKEFIRQVADHYRAEVEQDGGKIKSSYYLSATGQFIKH
jgi:hypothetical protein